MLCFFGVVFVLLLLLFRDFLGGVIFRSQPSKAGYFRSAGWTSRKKVPLGIWLKSTRPSHGRFGAAGLGRDRSHGKPGKKKIYWRGFAAARREMRSQNEHVVGRLKKKRQQTKMKTKTKTHATEPWLLRVASRRPCQQMTHALFARFSRAACQSVRILHIFSALYVARSVSRSPPAATSPSASRL